MWEPLAAALASRHVPLAPADPPHEHRASPSLPLPTLLWGKLGVMLRPDGTPWQAVTEEGACGSSLPRCRGLEAWASLRVFRNAPSTHCTAVTADEATGLLNAVPGSGPQGQGALRGQLHRGHWDLGLVPEMQIQGPNS